jgi:hypothetical protein
LRGLAFLPRKMLRAIALGLAVLPLFFVAVIATPAAAAPYDGTDPWGGTGCIYSSVTVWSGTFTNTYGGVIGGNVQLRFSTGCKTAFTNVAAPTGYSPRVYINRISPSWDLAYYGTVAFSGTGAWSWQVYDIGGRLAQGTAYLYISGCLCFGVVTGAY